MPDAHERVGVQGLAADGSKLYWVEYGTRDSLGNHQNDGALFAQGLAGGEAATQIATGLAGPVAVEVTSTHAYIFVDGAPLIGNVTHPQLVRIPLSGGTTELVEDRLIPTLTSFAAVRDLAFWGSQTDVAEQTAEPGAAPTVFLAGWAGALTSDGQSLFYGASNGTSDVIWRDRLDGHRAQALALALSIRSFAVSGDFIYGLENIDNDGIVLTRAAMTATSFQRARALGGGGSVDGLQIAGDRFFFASHPADGVFPYPDPERLNVTTGTLSSSEPLVRLLEAPVPSINQPLLWIGTATALYWSDGRAIYSQRL